VFGIQVAVFSKIVIAIR